METNLDNKIELDYSNVLSMGQIIGEVAACMLAGVNPGKNIINNLDGFIITNENARNLFISIRTWGYFHTESPFWFINEAIKKLIPIPKALLIDIREFFLSYLQSERENFLKDYPYIANKLDFKVEAIRYFPPPPYLDEKHINFSPEIACAIKLHTAITNPPYSGMKLSIRHKVDKWFQQNKTELACWEKWGIQNIENNTAFKTRMIRLVTPMARKSGGVLLVD